MIFCSELSAAGRVATISTAPQKLMVPASARSPIFFSTGVASPVRLDSSAAVPPLTISPSTGNCAPGLINNRAPGADFLHRHLHLHAAAVQDGGRLGRFAKQGTNLLLRAAQRVMFQARRTTKTKTTAWRPRPRPRKHAPPRPPPASKNGCPIPASAGVPKPHPPGKRRRQHTPPKNRPIFNGPGCAKPAAKPQRPQGIAASNCHFHSSA